MQADQVWAIDKDLRRAPVRLPRRVPDPSAATQISDVVLGVSRRSERRGRICAPPSRPTLSPSMPISPSVHDLAPLEQGGVLARQGFSYQDHIAAAFVLKMVSVAPTGGVLAAVWCETED